MGGWLMEARDLAKYFNEKLFIADLQAKSKDECLVELVKKFEENRLIRNMEILLEMLKQREHLGSTGIGKGIAIPHGRTTAVEDVMIAFGHSSTGIEYDSIDQKPVHLIFMVIAPPIERDNKYLPVLGKLVEVLNNDDRRKVIMNIKNYSDLIKCFSEV
jgi:fructose-specific phosphotransferase system IIA component